MLLSKVIQIFPEGRRDVVGQDTPGWLFALFNQMLYRNLLSQTRLKTHINDLKAMSHKAT